MAQRQSGPPVAVDMIAGAIMVAVMGFFLFPFLFDQIGATELAGHSGATALFDIMPVVIVLCSIMGIAFHFR